MHFQARKDGRAGTGTLQGIHGWLRQEGADRRCHSPERHEIFQCFLLPSKYPTVTERPENGGVGGRAACVDPRVQRKLQGREKRLFTPTSPSTHSLLVLPFSLLSDGYQSLGKCKRGEVDTELIFASFLKGGRCRDPSANNTASRSQKLRFSFLLPNPLFNAISLSPMPSQETHGFAKPL